MIFLRICVVLLGLVSFSLCQDHGVQMRLTKKGMDYTVNVGVGIMQKDLKKTRISKSGNYSKISFDVNNLTISEMNFGSYNLSPIQGQGMKGVVKDIEIQAQADLNYTYHSWIDFSDKTKFRLKASDIDFDLTLKIGSDKRGHPTISVLQCDSNVGKISLAFNGGLSFIYNLLSSVIESEMESTLKTLLCQMATKEINTKAAEELKTFPVVRKVDSVAEIDYRLTEAPLFTKTYMDALLKGEFKSSKEPKESYLPIPKMKSDTEDGKMLYFWVSDYTLNTAGLVYHEANKLQYTVNAWEKKAPEELKSLLKTTKFVLLYPKIIVDYPNEAMGVYVSSYKAPHVTITEKDANFHLYALATFSVKTKQLFTFSFEIKAGASIGVRQTNITAEIDYFNYDGKVTDSIYGQPLISLDNGFVKTLIETLVIKNANDALSQGFPLPKVDEVAFTNFAVNLQKDALEIGTDIAYVQKKR